MDRVFLDANVLFSAAYKTDSRLRQLWDLQDAQLVSSEYAVEEARRNLELVKPDSVSVLKRLVAKVTILPNVPTRLSLKVKLADKDMPILLAAVRTRATHLLTGDIQHFGHLLGETVHGVRIVTPAQYLRQRGARREFEG